jgi:glycolate oxidase iron-sulfur subunit
MQTQFSPEQLCLIPASMRPKKSCANVCIAASARQHVPTYVTLGNELDSPRGRIYLIKDMLENNRPADEQVVRHVDRLPVRACRA